MTTDFGPLVEAGNVFVAELSRKIIALVVLTPDGESLEISSLSVLAEFQRQGLGRLLLGFAEQRAVTLGLKALSLYTNAKLDELVGYYNECGFDVVDRRADEGFDRVFMRKHVSAQ
jgi:GNAT superfamily N-acetyltransferase